MCPLVWWSGTRSVTERTKMDTQHEVAAASDQTATIPEPAVYRDFVTDLLGFLSEHARVQDLDEVATGAGTDPTICGFTLDGHPDGDVPVSLSINITP